MVIQAIFNYQGKFVWDPTKTDGAPKKVMSDIKFCQVFPDFAFTPFAEGIAATITYYESVYPY